MKKTGFSYLALSSLFLVNCSSSNFSIAEKIKVMIERGDNYFVENPIIEINKGDDAVFNVTLTPFSMFVSASYPDYEISNQTDTSFSLTLKNVCYQIVVTLEVTHEFISYHGEEAGATSIRKQSRSDDHLRESSINAYKYFTKDGYLPIGWNTKEDLSGELISFGSRIPYEVKDLYLQWEKESSPSLFEFEQKGQSLTITKYFGSEEKVVVPSTYNGLKITKIDENAFDHNELKTLILGNNIEYIMENAISSPQLTTLYLCDSTSLIEDDAFPKSVSSIRINATTPPRFSGTYYDTFTDKIDYLERIKEDKKIVLFSGSSTRYGYYSPLIDEAYPNYKTINMGVFAYVNIKPQLDVITHFMKKEDVLLSSPEFDNHALEHQFGCNDDFEWQLFPFFEGNYDLLKYIDITKYDGFFDSFNDYLEIRKTMPDRDRSFSAKHYDDDNNYYAENIYNIQGDLILNRPGNAIDERLSQPIDEYLLETTITPQRIQCLNNVYESLKEKDITVLFTYSPKNLKCISSSTTLEERAKIQNYLKEHLIVPIISDWEDSLLPGTSFYLIDNHLSSLAAKERTERTIREIAPYLN